MRILQLHHICHIPQLLASTMKKMGHDAVFSDTLDGIDIGTFDVVHAHYAVNTITIRAFIGCREKKVPFILHCHGSDVRRVTPGGLKRMPWRYYLISKAMREGSDMVFLATPDLAEFSKGIYVPNPVDIERFRPMPDVNKCGRVLIVGRQVSPDLLLPLIGREREYDCINFGTPMDLPSNVTIYPNIPHDDFPAFLNRYDEMIGTIGDPISMARLEAMACGLKTYTGWPGKYDAFYNFENPDKVADPRAFIERWHHPEKVAAYFIERYKELAASRKEK